MISGSVVVEVEDGVAVKVVVDVEGVVEVEVVVGVERVCAVRCKGGQSQDRGKTRVRDPSQ